MARISITNCNNAVEQILVPGTTYYLALFTSDPGITGTVGEVTGGSYARQAIVFTGASGGIETNTLIITFTGMPAVAAIPFVAIFSAVTGGTYECGGLSGIDESVGSGATVTFPAGTVAPQIS
jgi:hypothetical protein